MDHYNKMAIIVNDAALYYSARTSTFAVCGLILVSPSPRSRRKPSRPKSTFRLAVAKRRMAQGVFNIQAEIDKVRQRTDDP